MNFQIQQVMNLESGILSPLSGMKTAAKKIAVSAENLANYSNQYYIPQSTLFTGQSDSITPLQNKLPSSISPTGITFNGLDFAEEITGQMMNQVFYTANARTLKSINLMKGTLIDIIS